MNTMGKKFLGTVLLLGVAAAGVWHYAAGRFEEQAKILVSTLDSMKPYVTYSEIAIDKYRFQIHMSNLSMGTGSTGIPASDPSKKPLKFQMDINAKNTLCYNPLTKILTLHGDEATNNAGQYVLHYGDKSTTLKPVIEGKEPVVQLGFSEHPNLINVKWVDVLKTIKQIDSVSGKIKYLNTANNKEVFSIDGMDNHVEFHFNPEDTSRPDYSLTALTEYKNLVFNEEFLAIIKEIMGVFIPSTADLAKIDSLYGISLNRPMNSKSRLKFSSPKLEMNPVIDLVKAGTTPTFDQFLPLMPSINLDIEAISDSAMGKSNVTYAVHYNKAELGGKFSVTGDLTATKEFQNLFAQYVVQGLKESMKGQVIKESDVSEMLPDLPSLSPVKFELLVDMSLKTGPQLKDLRFVLGCKDYQTTLTAQSTIPEVSGNLEIKNYKTMMKDLSAYLDRVAQKGHAIEGLTATIASLKIGAVTADQVVSQIGILSQDQSSMTVKGSYNIATGEGTINGKPLLEVISLLQPVLMGSHTAAPNGMPMHPEANQPAHPANPTPQPELNQPAQPVNPAQQPELSQPVQPVNPAQQPELSQPAQPENPAQQPELSQPAQPANPAQHPEPSQPAQPASPM
jgi:hypothetical protein